MQHVLHFAVLSLTGAWLGGVLPGRAAAPVEITLFPTNSPPLAFAAGEIQRAVLAQPQTQLKRITLKVTGQGAAQSFQLQRAGPEAVEVTGADPAGAMYGGLEIAEAIRLGLVAQLRPGEHRPYIEQRGIKFNVPLDVRTPSYSDNSDAAQLNLPEMWSMDFWRTMLDEMARHRYNVLTLWNLHPFPSIVKVPEYPEVALNDVLRARREHFDEKFSHLGVDMFRPAMLKEAEVVKRMSMEEKIAFWRGVMQHAQDRGIAVYWFTWNTFLFGAEGKHGLSREKLDDNLIRYFRASVRETVRTYPLLAGLGITAGEHMSNDMGGRDKESWLWETYGEGIRDALKDEPQRSFRLIHRLHMTRPEAIFKRWQDYPGPFELSYKYAVAHMYSITNPPFIGEVLNSLGNGRRTWLTVRNDDIYSFRWGDPEFARHFILAMPPADKLAGFYMGPDGYIWGRDFLSRLPEGAPRPTVIEKQWYSFMLWGRLAYDPTLPDDFFRRVLAARFGGMDADKLDTAWRAASRIFPQITRLVWGSIDVRWFPEACLSHPSYRGFYTVREFMERDPMPGSGVVGIKAWRKAVLAGQPPQGITPLQIADALAADARTVHQLLPELRARQGFNLEARATLNDLEMFALLGDYYAAKIRAACALALFDRTQEEARREEAVRQLQSAVVYWHAYAQNYARQYTNRVLYNRVGWVDRLALLEKVREEVKMAQEWKPGTVPSDEPAQRANARAD
ncbi:MAG: carbohydrate-binding family 6 protein [Verrucomicrobiae bacterium]|nr:carbohydrate-binding family 6 protein [Verrucomicrobiae bacterium]